MAKKTRMGRNLNALLGGATKNQLEPVESTATAEPVEAPANDKNDQPATISTAADKSLSGSQAKSEGSDHKTEDKSALTEVAKSATATAPSAAANDPEPDTHPTDRLRMLGVDQITRGEYQPRRHFDQTLLQELAESIKAQGLIQPILVRAYGGKYELIAGERRWRAAQLAGVTDIPAIVRDMDDQSVAAVSLIENIQRADLNPLEEAQALERLCGEFSMTHQQVAEAVGRSRVAVTNLMRLLELHSDVKKMVDEGQLDMGHARALLGAPSAEQPGLARRIVKENLTVRAVESLVKGLREGRSTTKTSSDKPDANIEALRKKLSGQLGAPVTIKHQKSGSGKLEISYSSLEELDGILSHIK